nr:hypothetical protein [Halomonas xianhensis]
MSCHGPEGEGNAAGGSPRLAGLKTRYDCRDPGWVTEKCHVCSPARAASRWCCTT